MNRRVLSFVALAITMLYGIGFAVIDTNTPYASSAAWWWR